MDIETVATRIHCPQCRVAIPTVVGYPDWCDRCGWSTAPEVPAAPAPVGLAKIYRTVGARESARLLREATEQPAVGRTSILLAVLAFAIAALVHLITLTPLALAVAVIAWLWPSPISIFPASLLLLLAWVLAPQLPEKPEILLDREEFPATYALVDAVAAALKTPRVSGIACDMAFNAAFGQAGWQRQRIVHIGAPLWTILNDDERVALIAHELAHSANGDFGRSFFVGGAITSLARWSQLLAPSTAVEDGGVLSFGFFVMRCLSLVPRVLLTLLLHLLWHDSQRAEYAADRLAATIGGTAAQIGLLHKIYFAREYQHLLKWVLQGSQQSGIFAALRRRVSQLPLRELERQHYLAQHEQARLDITHPPTGYRIAALKSQPRPALASLVATIDRHGLAEEMRIIETVFEQDIGALFDRPSLWG